MHMGRLFIEPNLYIATTEFFVALLGLVVLGIMMFLSVFPEERESKHDDAEERTGYETNNKAAYA